MNEKGFFNECVPKKFASVTLESCDMQTQNFHDFARAWAKKPVSIVLMGDVGRGKTQFAFAMIRELFRNYPKGFWPRYYTSPNLDSILLEALMAEGGDRVKIQNLGEEHLLFIDDFGRENDTERVKRQYFELLNQRYANGRPTMISTNFTLEEIGRRLTPAIASRFQEWAMLKFEGEDLRGK